MDFDFTEGEILTPREIRDWARQLQKEAGDPQEILAGQIDRSQAAISKALREADESETRYVKTCIRIIEHYRDDVTIDYPRGRIELS